MNRGLLTGGLFVILAAVTALVVATSSAGGGGKGPYRFYSGPVFVDQNSIPRVFIANASGQEPTVKVTFRTNTGDDVNDVPLPSGGSASASGATCGQGSCEVRAEIKSRTPLLAPTLRYQDADGAAQEKLAGDWIVVRDGKRVY